MPQAKINELILSNNIGNLKTIWGNEKAGTSHIVSLSELDIPIVLRTGRGYDVFGKYASIDSLKQSVLDLEKLTRDQRIERIRYDQGENSRGLWYPS